MLHFPFILGSDCLLDYFDVSLILPWGLSSLLSCCVVHFQESLCWQLVVSALVTAFMVRNFLPERGDLYSLECLWSFGLPLIAEIEGGIWEVTKGSLAQFQGTGAKWQSARTPGAAPTLHSFYASLTDRKGLACCHP